MRRRILFIALLLTSTLVASANVAATAGSPLPQRFIVQFAGSSLPPDLRTRLVTLGVTEAVAFETINAVAITAPATAVEGLVASGDVVAARAERRIQLHLASSVPYIDADRATLGQEETRKIAGKPVVRHVGRRHQG